MSGQFKMESETISITSKVHTAVSVLGTLFLVLFIILLILLMVVISDTIYLNSSLVKIHEIAEVITNKYGWLLEKE